MTNIIVEVDDLTLVFYPCTLNPQLVDLLVFEDKLSSPLIHAHIPFEALIELVGLYGKKDE
jgi:hypothetical protein